MRDLLDAMCIGARRCAYCEDSMADEVEHIRPRNLYPDEVFVWQNYLYACGPCNGGKRSSFAVFDQATNNIINVTRKRNSPVVSTTSGDAVFIEAKVDDPEEFMMLDLTGTFLFVPIENCLTHSYQRAKYTIHHL